MIARISLALVVLVLATAASAQPADDAVRFEGRACRINRSANRFIVMTSSGLRLRVAAGSETEFRFGRDQFEPADLRPGDIVRVTGRQNSDDIIEADTIRLRPDVVEAIWDVLVPSKSTKLIGRFGVREAKTEFFSLDLPGLDYVRVDARAAYGGSGRVRVSNLKIGDLLEVRGEWVSDGLFKASYIDIQTDTEPASCRMKMPAEEAAAERAFLGK